MGIRFVLTLVLIVAGGTRAEAQIRLLESVSGTRGEIQGTRFVIEDPRTVFNPKTDRQVVVYFEWEGAPGVRQCLARWKDPASTVVLAAPYKVTAATKRFGVFWTLALPEIALPGVWTVEAEVDGVAAGEHKFQIEAPAVVEVPASRPVVRPQEMYELARKATLELQALDARGGLVRVGAGFRLAEQVVLTDFGVIDGAARIRIVGEPLLETDLVLAFDSEYSWAALRVSVPEARSAALCRTCPTRIGDRYSFLRVESGGLTTLSGVAVAGFLEVPGGRRLTFTEGGPCGAPVFDLHGDVVAMFSRRPVPELGPVSSANLSYLGPRVEHAVTPFATPISSLPQAFPEPPRQLSELAARGVFVLPLAEERGLVVTGGIASELQGRSDAPIPVGQSAQLRRSQGAKVAFATVRSDKRREGQARFRVWTLKNRLAMEGEAVKLKARARDATFLWWPLHVEQLPTGVYRLDLDLDGVSLWRAYFRVTD